MVKDIFCENSVVKFSLVFSSEKEEIREKIVSLAKKAVSQIPGVSQVEIKRLKRMSEASGPERIPGVKNIIAVASGKGGVGKSALSTNIALALKGNGTRVGLLDADIYGPSIPLMMGIHEQPKASMDNKILPLSNYGIKVMSLGFLLTVDSPVIWRGPMVTQVVKQFLQGVEWDELDYLVIDLPPGTGDTQLTLVQTVPLDGAVIVTTPQPISLIDARKALAMFKEVNVPVLGIIENMSYFVCPHCRETTEIFGYGGGKETSKVLGVEFLGEIPINPEIRKSSDHGIPVVESDPSSPVSAIFIEIGERIKEHLKSIKKRNNG
jgi:ATP-binding protein involved in chromosome partitioning